LKEEALGWASEWKGGGILTPKKASEIREELQTAYRLGKDVSTLAARRERAKQENFTKKTIFEFFFEKIYLPQIEANKAPNTVRTEKMLFNLWIKPVIGRKTLNQIDPLDLECIKKNMSDAQKSPRLIQYALAVIRQVFNYAKILDIYHKDNPVSKVKKPSVDNRRLRFLTKKEADLLLAELRKRSQQLHDIALLSLHCGLRAGEIFNLTWDCINFEKEQILIKDPKNRNNRYAFMTAKVKNMLKQRYQGKSNDLIFKDRKGKKIVSVSKAFFRAVEDLGFNKDIEDRRQKVVFHTLRHTYASWLVERGVDLYTVKELMGHKTLAMTERYSHLGENTLKQAVSRLDETLGD
jgi:integrase